MDAENSFPQRISEFRLPQHSLSIYNTAEDDFVTENLAESVKELYRNY